MSRRTDEIVEEVAFDSRLCRHVPSREWVALLLKDRFQQRVSQRERILLSDIKSIRVAIFIITLTAIEIQIIVKSERHTMSRIGN